MMRARLLLVALDQRLHRAMDAVLDQASHAQELVAQRLQIGVEMVPFHPLESLPAASGLRSSSAIRLDSGRARPGAHLAVASRTAR